MAAKGSETTYDAVVIGGGHNGLTTAALLAKRGRKVVLLEKRDTTGGLAAADEFYPGFHSPGVLHDTSGVRHHLVASLGLARHGLVLEPEPPSLYGCSHDGEGLHLYHDPGRAAGEISKFSKRDAGRYAEYRDFLKRVSSFINGLFDDAPMSLGSLDSNVLWPILKKGLGFKRLGRSDMVELIRVIPMSLADWLDEWFESDLLKSILAMPAIRGAFVGPRSPGSAFNLLLWECRKGSAVRGGSGALVKALEGAARSAGVEIRTGVGVSGIDVDGGRASGVTLADGEGIKARLVAASNDPKSVFFGMIPGIAINEKLAHRIHALRSNGTTAKVDIGLKQRLQPKGAAKTDVEFFSTGQSLTEIEKAFDAVKYRQCSDRPILDVAVPNGDGGPVMSALVHYAPYDLEGGWNDDRRDALGARVVEMLSEVVPGLGDQIETVRVLTPADIESHFGTSGGHVHHGDHMLDQLFVRPSPECARHHTPIRGLFLCGSGSYPGGGITCAPGALAAQAILSLI
ncbi:MAG: NAD(P)/FAD-dependent oxidoreductase [Candidatus Latescibacterota bacterium]|nr:MAG: NAD(P)/FAD-dependent oxidoreductase [Candidatus Latescibacterota bacterium]